MSETLLSKWLHAVHTLILNIALTCVSPLHSVLTRSTSESHSSCYYQPASNLGWLLTSTQATVLGMGGFLFLLKGSFWQWATLHMDVALPHRVKKRWRKIEGKEKESVILMKGCLILTANSNVCLVQFGPDITIAPMQSSSFRKVPPGLTTQQYYGFDSWKRLSQESTINFWDEIPEIDAHGYCTQ